MKCKEVLEAKN